MFNAVTWWYYPEIVVAQKDHFAVVVDW
jgi:hypothetical protein